MTRRILFDAYWLTDGPPSGRNVVVGLLNGWAQAHPHDSITAAVQPSFDTSALHSSINFKEQKSRVGNHGTWVLGELGVIARNYDAVVCQNFTPAIRIGRPRIATFFHDAIFATNPEWFTWQERGYMGLASKSLSRADVVLTSSRSEAARIARTHPRLSTSVESVGLALPDTFIRAGTRTQGGTAAGKFVLCVGRLNARKNIKALIEAFVTANLPHHKLVIVGTPDGKTTDARPALNVEFTGSVSDEELAHLYATCDFFAFPSLGEGFGLPLLEAAYFGAPTIASDIPSFREIGTPAAYFDPRNMQSIVAALKEMAGRSGGREARLVKPNQDYTWELTARRARDALFPEKTHAR